MRIFSLLNLLVAAGTAFFIWWPHTNGSQHALTLQSAVKTGLIIASVVWFVFALFDFISAISEDNINSFFSYCSRSLTTVFSSPLQVVDGALSHETTKKKISTIHRAIRSLSPDIIFSDPHRIISLPFPSPLEIPIFFNLAKSQDDVDMFQYFGRSIFASLLEEVQNPDFLLGRHDLYLYGPSGAGKSHLLAALVCHLVRDKKRVIYIPDCRRLLRDTHECLRRALLFAYHDNHHSCETIGKAKSTDDLVEFVRGLSKGSIYLVVDQREVLEVVERDLDSENHDLDASAKLKAWEYLRLMSYSSLYIFCASANHHSDRRASQIYGDIKYFSPQAGLSEEEADAWFKLHSTSLPDLSEESRTFVKHITGYVPLLLHSLLRFRDKPFNEATFLRSKELVDVKTNINSFYDRIFRNLSEEDRERCFDIMQSCLLETGPSRFYQSLVDLRYFYLDGAKVARCSCGMAFQTLVSRYREERFHTASGNLL